MVSCWNAARFTGMRTESDVFRLARERALGTGRREFSVATGIKAQLEG